MVSIPAWITVDEDNRVYDVKTSKEKPVPVHSDLKVVEGTICFEQIKD